MAGTQGPGEGHRLPRVCGASLPTAVLLEGCWVSQQGKAPLGWFWGITDMHVFSYFPVGTLLPLGSSLCTCKISQGLLGSHLHEPSRYSYPLL